MSDDLEGNKELWQPGERAWFEYHCYEGHDSGDAQAWYRSHQQVSILAGPFWDDEPVNPAQEAEDIAWWRTQSTETSPARLRGEFGAPYMYQVRFDDGLEYTVFEDELLTGPEFYYRPDPPKPKEEA